MLNNNAFILFPLYMLFSLACAGLHRVQSFLPLTENYGNFYRVVFRFFVLGINCWTGNRHVPALDQNDG